MLLLNVLDELSLTPSGAQCTTVMRQDLLLHEHWATSIWHQMSSVRGVVGYLLDGGCQQVYLDIQLSLKGEVPGVYEIGPLT
jgi:hypothetical protein